MLMKVGMKKTKSPWTSWRWKPNGH